MERRSTISFIQSYYECRNEIQTFIKIRNVRKRKESLWAKIFIIQGKIGLRNVQFCK